MYKQNKQDHCPAILRSLVKNYQSVIKKLVDVPTVAIRRLMKATVV